MKTERLENIVGKTIAEAKLMRPKGYCDESYLWIKFTDGTDVLIESYYGSYVQDVDEGSPGSLGEYPCYLSLLTMDEFLMMQNERDDVNREILEEVKNT
jgi:hypothetical protein